MLVFIALASFIYYYLLPSGHISDTAKSVLSVLTVAAVCVPVFVFFNGDEPFFYGFSSNGEAEPYEPYSYYADIAVKTADEKVSLIVRRYTDASFFVDVDVNISEDMCIDIEQVSVIFEKKPDGLPELSQEIQNELGIAPHFVLKETDDDKETDPRKTEE